MLVTLTLVLVSKVIAELNRSNLMDFGIMLSCVQDIS